MGGAAALLLTEQLVTEGVSFNKPPLRLRSFTIGMDPNDDIRLFEEHINRIDDEGTIIRTADGKALFEPRGPFFSSDMNFLYGHRLGNSPERIEEAYEEGADLFDLDTSVYKGIIYVEHGIVLPQLVVDVNEAEVKIGMPHTFEEVIYCIASLSSEERQLAAALELKRGYYGEKEVRSILNTLDDYGVPAIVSPSDPGQLAFLGNERMVSYSRLD